MMPGEPHLRRFLVRHAVFVIALGAGLALRVAAALAYRPALMFYGDSFTYLACARPLTPYPYRPAGYSMFLWPFAHLGAVAWVAPLQHALGLALAIGLYAFLLRARVPRLVAAAATLPLLLDGLQVALEQFLMADLLFEALLAGALVALAWHERATWRQAAVVGALAALAALTRTVGIVFLPLVVAHAWARGRDGRAPAAALTAVLVPLLLYSGWCALRTGRLLPESRDGYFLYGRVATFADARAGGLGDLERTLCDPRPPAGRPNANFYVWSQQSPAARLAAAGHPSEDERNAILARFARGVIARQPGAYTRVVARDVLHYFGPHRRTGPQDEPLEMWRFPLAVPVDGHVFLGAAPTPAALPAPAPQPPARLARFLRRYQDAAATPGPLLALALAIGLLAPVARRRRAAPAAALAAFAFATGAFLLLLVPAATVMFDYRYLVPALALAPVAAALAFARAPRSG
jgi:hypothetical protein